MLQIAQDIGAEGYRWPDSTYTAEIYATLWPVADGELRQEIERRVLDLPAGLPLSTGLACVRVPAAKEFRSGELERLYRSLDDLVKVNESDLSLGMNGSAVDATIDLLGRALSECGKEWPTLSFRRLLDRCAFVSRDRAAASVFGVQLPDNLRARFIDRLGDVLEMLP